MLLSCLRRICQWLTKPEGADDYPPAGDMTSLLDSIDGLIVSGGPDISPATYNEEPGPMTTEFYPEQDYSEMGLIEGALERDLPF